MWEGVVCYDRRSGTRRMLASSEHHRGSQGLVAHVVGHQASGGGEVTGEPRDNGDIEEQQREQSLMRSESSPFVSSVPGRDITLQATLRASPSLVVLDSEWEAHSGAHGSPTGDRSAHPLMSPTPSGPFS